MNQETPMQQLERLSRQQDKQEAIATIILFGLIFGTLCFIITSMIFSPIYTNDSTTAFLFLFGLDSIWIFTAFAICICFAFCGVFNYLQGISFNVKSYFVQTLPFLLACEIVYFVWSLMFNLRYLFGN
jgi:hypothetical protein